VVVIDVGQARWLYIHSKTCPPTYRGWGRGFSLALAAGRFEAHNCGLGLCPAFFGLVWRMRRSRRHHTRLVIRSTRLNCHVPASALASPKRISSDAEYRHRAEFEVSPTD